ncbi:MAG: phenylalanine--tRNA ligase subunit beta [Myxococcota bacterium]
MRVPLGWLSEWVDLPESSALLEERLTLAGLEIEDVERQGPDLSAFRVGEVLECGPHPNADRLSLCRVTIGEGDPLEIVCGAPNVSAGQKVVVAQPGTTLPDGTRLKRTKIRGVTSVGMICSARELGLGEDHDGILVLDPQAPVGAPASEVVASGETVLDLEITPNRGDWASLLGIAREVRALFGGPLRIPPHAPPEGERSCADDVSVRIEDEGGCSHYVARVVRGIQLGPSPRWLRQKLEAGGMRPLNVVVDVTNLVLLEFGQPLHAFDLSTVRGGLVCVRAARAGEKLQTLDGQTRELVPEDLVIADAERAIALAGVMGGAESEVRPQTRDVLIESALFHPSRIRRMARRLGLRTEASYRFERGVDPEGVRRAADRAARLLAELAGGDVSRGTVEARGAVRPRTEEVVLDPARVNRLLGTELTSEEIVALLGRLELRAALDADGRLRCRIPSHRGDLQIAEDLVEEVARIHGYDRIPIRLPVCELRAGTAPARYELADRVRDCLCGLGLLEMRSFPGISARELDALRLPEDHPLRAVVQIRNPIIEGDSRLRTTLVPSLLRAVRTNLARQCDRVRLFEVSHVFHAREEGPLPREPSAAGLVLTRGEPQDLWERRDPPPLFFELRGLVEHTLDRLGIEAVFRAGQAPPYLHPGASGTLVAGRKVVAQVGELHPDVAAFYGIEVPCAVGELDLSAIEELPRRPRRLRDLSRQPAVRRDLAVLLDRDRPAGEILEAIRKCVGPALVSVTLFDRYEGKGIPDGKVSLAFRLVFQRPDRTLKESEIKRMMERVVQTLAQRFGGELRGGPPEEEA